MIKEIICTVGLALALIVSEAHSAPRRAFTPADIMKLRSLTDLTISADGTAAAFVQSEIVAGGERREQTIWLLGLEPEQPARRLTSGSSDTKPGWSPDGSLLAFLRTTPGSKDSVTQLFVIDVKAGQERQLTQLERGVEDFQWSPDGAFIALLSRDQGDARSVVSPEPGVHIITRAKYRTGGAYLDFANPSQLWTLDVKANTVTLRRLTHGRQPAEFVGWTPDSARVLYTVNETDEPYYGGGVSGLYEASVATGVTRRLRTLKDPSGKNDVASAPRFALSPSGKTMAFVDDAPNAPGEFAQPDLYVFDRATGTARNLTEHFDHDIEDGPVWVGEHHLLAVSLDQGTGNIVEVDVRSGKSRQWTQGLQTVQSLASAPRARRVLAVISTPDTPEKIYDVSHPGKQRRLTSINDGLRSETALAVPESLWFKARDGVKVHAFLYRPPGFDPARHYPLIFLIHGGPFGLWTAEFRGDIQSMAGAGYLVLCPNVRGSQSYGQAFASALAPKWPGGRDFDDLMDIVDAVSQLPYVDKTQLAITGSSAGGIMTDWAITHTDRFAAAVSISSIADFDSEWFVGDQPYFGEGAELPDRRASFGAAPIDSVQNVKTPTLFIAGERDYRTPPSIGSEPMFRALKFLRVPTAMIRFDTAGHSIYRSEYPQHPSLAVHYTLRWLDKFLKAAAVPEFDVAEEK